ncbi:TPA: hypothetical protein EYP70_01690, partial [Candidatus Bathyarchaeota archaeon]|nr:hypothetical protein [Candidatus Bathyarchaeota archaeon]
MQNKFNGSNSYMPSRRNNFVLESFKHFSIEKARKAQSLLAKKVLTKDLVHKPLRFIAGVDVAYFGSYSIGAVAILDIESKKTVEMETKVQKTMFPYIPTLLSFREIPP